MKEKDKKELKWFERRPLVALAPMEAITDYSYRQIVRKVAPEVIIYTEFTNASGLRHGAERVWKMLDYEESERPFVVQIYDNNNEEIAWATGEVASKLRPDGIDLNMGCPVKKVANRGAGCGMMAEPDKSAEAVKMMVDKAAGIPISVKMRLGIHHKDEVVEVAGKCIEAGAQQVTIHARLKSDRPRIPADWPALEKAASQLNSTIMGNGDIWHEDDAEKMVALEGIDGVMIGRGAIGNPWLLNRIWQKLAGQEVDGLPTRQERAEIALEHLRMNVKHKGERRGVIELRKIVRHYIKGYPDTRKTWLKLIEVETESATSAILEEFSKGIDIDLLNKY